MQIRKATQGSVELLGLIVLLSWFGLYLEIYRYHHLVISRIGSVVWPSARAGARPGGFLRSVVACSILAPMMFIALWLSTRIRMARDLHGLVPQRGFSTPSFLMISGAALILLAVANQIIRHPPIIVDLTLRAGNGGFVILGLTLAIVGAVLRSRKRA